jgi:hypothetical protein
MKLEIRNNKDFWAGMMFLGTGAGAMLMARHYPFGSTLRMGPGYFPVILSGILILFGIYVTARGLRNNEKIKGNWSDCTAVIDSRLRCPDESGGVHPGARGLGIPVGGGWQGVQTT